MGHTEVALTGGPEGDTLIRRAARVADRSAGGDLLAVHVTHSDGLAAGASHASLARQRRLIEDLGGSYHSVIGDDVAAALVEFAPAENATSARRMSSVKAVRTCVWEPSTALESGQRGAFL